MQGKIDWARSGGVALRDTGGRNPDGVRLIRLKANRDMNRDVQLPHEFKREWGRGEEIILSYTPEGDDTSAGSAAPSGTRKDSGGGQRRKAHDDVIDSMAAASDDPASPKWKVHRRNGSARSRRKYWKARVLPNAMLRQMFNNLCAICNLKSRFVHIGHAFAIFLKNIRHM